MSKRFGRNQRRRARERISELDLAEQVAINRAIWAERSLKSARKDGAEEILRIRYLPVFMERLGQELVRAYGPEIARAAETIIRNDRQNPARPLFTLSATPDAMDERVTILGGDIKPISYRIAVRP